MYDFKIGEVVGIGGNAVGFDIERTMVGASTLQGFMTFLCTVMTLSMPPSSIWQELLPGNDE